MSGGHFDYKDSSLFDFTNRMEEDLLNEHFEFSETRELILLIIEETKKNRQVVALLRLDDERRYRGRILY